MIINLILYDYFTLICVATTNIQTHAINFAHVHIVISSGDSYSPGVFTDKQNR